MNRLLLLFAGLLITFDFGLSSVTGLETDIWWHLAAGRRLWAHGWETVDPFSFSFAGQPWIRIDWLFQAAAWAVYSVAGLAGLLYARALLLSLSWAMLWRVTLVGGCTPIAGWLLSLCVCHIGSQSVALRPFAVTFFFTCALLMLLEEARHSRPIVLWLVPPLIAIWYNFHIAAIGGVLTVFIYAVGQLAARTPNARKWVVIAVLSAAAAFCTPQPWELFIHPIYFTLFQSAWNHLIVELQFPGWNWPGTTETRLLACLALLGSLNLARKKQWQVAFLAPVLSVLLLTHYRHQFQFSPALLPAIAAGLPFPRMRTWSTRAFYLLVGFVVLRSAASLVVHKLPASQLVRRETFPESVVQGLKAAPGALRLFTDMDSAGYYIFALADQHKVFIDSRTDQVYAGEDFLREYLRTLAGAPGALQSLQRWDVDVVINHRAVTGDSPLFAAVLPSSADWVRVYADNIAEVYARRQLSLGNQFLLQPYLAAYNEAGAGPDPQTSAMQALRDYPEFSSAWQLLGRRWLQEGRTDLARQALARAELYNDAAPGIEQDWRRYGGPWSVPWLRHLLLPFLALF